MANRFGRRFTADVDRGLDGWGGQIALLEHHVPRSVEHLDGEAVEPLSEFAVGPVVDHDRIDRLHAAKIHLPPRVGLVFLGVALATFAVNAVLVAVDRAARRAVEIGALLLGAAVAGDILAAAVDFHFGER